MPPLLKRLLFRTHWLLGLGAGLVLAVMGLTGALLAFEDELTRALNRDATLVAAGRAPLPPERWIAAALAARPGLAVANLTWNGADRAVELRLLRGQERGSAQRLLIDPYTATVLGPVRGAGFFDLVNRLHRNLALGAPGKQLTGAATLSLIVLALTGLVLRWPRRAGSARAWLRVDVKLRGRSLLWHLHAILATWTFVFYLLFALTGLWWSYDTYRGWINGLAGVPTPAARGGGPRGSDTAPDIRYADAWQRLRSAVPDAVRVTFGPPRSADAPIEFRYLLPDSPHERAYDVLRVDADGSVRSRERYADQPRGRRFVASIFPLHTGSWFGPGGRIATLLAAALMPWFAISGLWLWLQRRRTARRTEQARRAPGTAAAPAVARDVHASRGDAAEHLATASVPGTTGSAGPGPHT